MAKERHRLNSLSSGRSASQTSLSMYSGSDHTLGGAEGEEEWDIAVAPLSPASMKSTNRSKRTAIVARSDSEFNSITAAELQQNILF